MALTRNFKTTIKERAKRDEAFRRALLQEAIECFFEGDVATGKSILRDYINATVGFDELAEITGKSPKSLMRMFSAAGNPTADNLFAVLTGLQRKEGIKLSIELH